MGKLTMVKRGDFVQGWVESMYMRTWGWEEPSSGRRRDLHPQQLIRKDVPEDRKEEEGDKGEDDDPPGALLLQALLVAAQNQQPHANTHHGPRQVCHEAGLGSR